MDEAEKKQAREFLLKARVYKLLAAIFAIFGIILFLVLYAHYFAGDILKSLKDPMLILLVVFPFLPSIILSMKARKAEQALRKMILKQGE